MQAAAREFVWNAESLINLIDIGGFIVFRFASKQLHSLMLQINQVSSWNHI
jgi:hypothetical protein